jgi:hypothetical protein
VFSVPLLSARVSFSLFVITVAGLSFIVAAFSAFSAFSAQHSFSVPLSLWDMFSALRSPVATVLPSFSKFQHQ